MSTFGEELTIETPEQTLLAFPLAGIGSRGLALALDTLLQTAAGALVMLLFALLPMVAKPLQLLGEGLKHWLGQWALAAVIIAFFLIYFGYFAIFEALWSGQTPGKRLAQLRAIKDNGAPIGAYESVIRNLLRLVDSLPTLYAVGVVTALISVRHKRLGDYAAGTVVVHEKDFGGVRPEWGSVSGDCKMEWDVACITVDELKLVEAFLQRRGGMPLHIRYDLAGQIADRLGARIGVEKSGRADSEKFLEALAQRRRNLSRFA